MVLLGVRVEEGSKGKYKSIQVEKRMTKKRIALRTFQRWRVHDPLDILMMPSVMSEHPWNRQ
jgi:hypothetical protein